MSPDRAARVVAAPPAAPGTAVAADRIAGSAAAAGMGDLARPLEAVRGTHGAPPAGDAGDVDARVHRRVLASGVAARLDRWELVTLVRDEAPLLAAADVDAVVDRVLARIGGVGPLEPLLADPAVTDVLVNGPGAVWVERAGRLASTPVVLDRKAIALLVERVVAPLGL